MAAVAGGVLIFSGLVGTYFYRKKRNSKLPITKRTQVKAFILSQDAFLSNVSQSKGFFRP